MAAVQHLQIINPSHPHGTTAMFSLFSSLAIELRIRIWEYVLKHHRLLKFEIKDNGPSPSPDSTTKTPGQDYTATIQGIQLYSKLLRVNREARKAALKFYRVHIPCYLPTSDQHQGSKKGTKSIIYINPEYDILHLCFHHPAEHGVVSFMHDLKTHDPLSVGLLNLALGPNSMTALHSITALSHLSTRTSFLATLTQMRNLIWMADSHAGRAILGFFEGFPATTGVRFNHSMPIKPSTPSFDLLPRDPRAVGPELRQVLTAACDPREMRVQWRALLARLGIQQAVPTRERVLFACDPPQYEEQVRDARSAARFVREEEERWLRTQQRWSMLVRQRAGRVPVEGPAELAAAVRPAVGFWLFPAEALGDLNGAFGGMKNVFDMTGYWPELGLSNLT
jgi:hypothetical protein